ncbi:alkaline phosphatase family protein [Kitasatospora sp. HPMI-4]|uniref:alkaline phosphatase family protein n=1 Tax=Kitasatospora sp. HPMI-4 TaxID=3448443 RepID=UPI003F1B7738
MPIDNEGNLPAAVYRALELPPPPGGMEAIKHVVLLMQENRSFDHYFADLPGVRGFGDRNAVRLPTGRGIFDQPYGDPGKGHAIRPFLLPSDGSGDESIDHTWETGHQAWSSGWYDDWVEAKKSDGRGRGDTMGYYGVQGVPIYRELADRFTICDAYHSSVLSETTSNRNYWFSGYGGYEPDGTRVTGAEAHNSRENTDDAYQWTSYPEWLDANGKTWKVYQQWDNFYDNNLEFHAEFKRIFRALLKDAGLPAPYQSLFDFYEYLQGNKKDDKPTPQQVEDWLAALERQVAKLPEPDRQLYERGLRRHRTEERHEKDTPRGFVQAFLDDIKAKKLPQVSYLVAAARDTEHPDNPPGPGQEVVYQVLKAIAEDPEIWKSTVLLLSYDENDGLFDHVPPPVPPAGINDELVDGVPIGLGARVPLIVVSPWSTGGYVCSQVFDHTSQVRFLEQWLGVRQPWISRWRRTVAGDLTSAFEFNHDPTAQQVVPPGRRKARPLPYQVDADGTWNTGRRSFTVRMTNTGKASAHLTVYPYAGEYPNPLHLDVLGAHQEDIPTGKGRYDFTLTGPNGFRREFAGKADGPAADVRVSSALSAEPRQLEIHVVNGSAAPVTLTLTPLAYAASLDPERRTVQPGGEERFTWKTEDASGWYDLQVSITEDPGFHRRLMGHIENGAVSLSG